MFHLGAGEIIALVFLALLLFGANRLPQVMRAAGEGIKEFKKASRDILSDIESTTPAKGSGQSQEKSDDSQG